MSGAPSSRGESWRRAADLTGRVCISLGALVLVFFAFQLWGTGILERQAQQDLADELDRAIAEHRLREASNDAETAVGPGPTTAATMAGNADDGDKDLDVVLIPRRPRPEPGSAVARIKAPTIGLDKTVVEGVGRPQLRAGPGLYPIAPQPGHRGNVAIAGHRTTHGSPFADLDRLEPGDAITLETVDGTFIYRVEAQRDADGVVAGHRIVSPDAVEVIADRGDNRLTLTSCHPRYSDRERLIVTAVLEGPAVAYPPPSAPFGDRAPVPDRLDLGLAPALADERLSGDIRSEGSGQPSVAVTGLDEPLGWQLDQLGQALLWALATVAALIPSVVLSRRGRRVLAVAILLPLLSYPLVALLTTIDAMAPAL